MADDIEALEKELKEAKATNETLKGENFKYREERRGFNEAEEELKLLRPLAKEYETLKAGKQSDKEKADQELVELHLQIKETKASHEALQRDHLAQQAAISNGVPIDLLPSLNMDKLDFADETAVTSFFKPFADKTPTATKMVNPGKGESALTMEQFKAMHPDQRANVSQEEMNGLLTNNS